MSVEPLPVTSKPETWVRQGEDPGYDPHIALLVEVWESSDGSRSDDRPLHDFLHMSWPQYQHYTSEGSPDE